MNTNINYLNTYKTIVKVHNLYNIKGIPEVLWFGKTSQNNIMVMEQLGYSLEDLFQKCGRKFSLKTVLMLGDQMVFNIYKGFSYLVFNTFIPRTSSIETSNQTTS